MSSQRQARALDPAPVAPFPSAEAQPMDPVKLRAAGAQRPTLPETAEGSVIAASGSVKGFRNLENFRNMERGLPMLRRGSGLAPSGAARDTGLPWL
ncbi:hypothetical protein ILT44_00125 [Microvirga sp. BT689]|uniref:hypothetical protein n=1 Tax=Microvirga arvi TaxID=2778731 RepID=UPI00194E0DE0|nr:hypothetical protein [Microvirga arvi]MBM6578569.1 hypothetical protein [Microvirga arvi]